METVWTDQPLDQQVRLARETHVPQSCNLGQGAVMLLDPFPHLIRSRAIVGSFQHLELDGAVPKAATATMVAAARLHNQQLLKTS